MFCVLTQNSNVVLKFPHLFPTVGTYIFFLQWEWYISMKPLSLIVVCCHNGRYTQTSIKHTAIRCAIITLPTLHNKTLPNHHISLVRMLVLNICILIFTNHNVLCPPPKHIHIHNIPIHILPWGKWVGRGAVGLGQSFNL